MMMNWFFCVQLFFLILGNSFAWDGCGTYSNSYAWRCGDTCIAGSAECKCGDEIFGHKNQKWCCHNSCTGKGEEKEEYGYWLGEKEGNKKIGAQCTGRALNLTEACDKKCNFYEEDENRNTFGVLRAFMPCETNHMKTTECVQEDKMRDGKYDCRNRADEEAFQTHIGNSSSLLLDLEKILIPCKDRMGAHGVKGFKCTRPNQAQDCLRMYLWCYPDLVHSCSELEGTTATGKTIDPQLCSNQSFWEHKTCNYNHLRRCTGDTPGQCGELKYKDHACKDGSSRIEIPQNGTCGDDLMCRATIGWWWKKKVCIKDQYKCDGVVHCDGEEDEANCNQTATKKCWWEDCSKAYQPLPDGHCENKDDLMCRARDGKWAGENICLKKKFLCDNYLQCQDGKDEKQCEDEYLRKGFFPRDYNYVCRSVSLNISNEKNETGKFFPMRAIRCHHPVIISNIITIMMMTRCDTIVQCPHGEDEEGCHISETTRLVMSLFL